MLATVCWSRRETLSTRFGCLMRECIGSLVGGSTFKPDRHREWPSTAAPGAVAQSSKTSSLLLDFAWSSGTASGPLELERFA